MKTTTDCPYPGCEVLVSRGMFACKKHWFTLPRDLRSRIWDNYRSQDLDRILSGYDEAEAFWSGQLQGKASP